LGRKELITCSTLCSTPPNAAGGNSEEDTGSSLRKIQVVLKIQELGFFFVLQLYNRLLKFLAKGWLNNNNYADCKTSQTRLVTLKLMLSGLNLPHTFMQLGDSQTMCTVLLSSLTALQSLQLSASTSGFLPSVCVNAHL